MRNVIFVIFLLLSNTICAQTTFEKRFVINSYSASNSIVQVLDEGFIVLGDDRQNEDGLHQDIVLLKLDHYGELIWSSHYGTQYDDYGNVLHSSISESKKLQFEIYPNPSRNKFIVKAFEPISKIEIVDIMGSLKYYQVLESEVTEYEYSGKKLESGIYIVRVSIGVSELSRILIVE